MASTRSGNRLDRSLGLEPGDRLVLLLMGAQIACLLAAYTIAKVLRDSMFLSAYGADRLPWAYVTVALAAVGLIALEARIARRLPASRISVFTQTSAIAISFAAAMFAPAMPAWLPAAFYVWTGSQALLLVSHFWIAAIDAWDSQRARRIFPLLTGCGLLGGVAGGALAGFHPGRPGATTLLWTLCGLLAVFRVFSFLIELKLPERPLTMQVAAAGSQWRTFRDSPFLRSLAATLALAVVVSTLVDFQFKAMAQEAFPDPSDLSRFFGRFYAGLNVLALVVQFGVAGFILRHVGLGAASGLQPVSMLALGAGLFVVPAWPLAQAMRWVQGLVQQTLGKSSSEIYFMAIRPPERRQIKPTLDVVVERGSDAVAGLLLIAAFQVLGAGPRIVAGLIALVGVAWIVLLFGLHRRYVRAFRASLAAPWAEPATGLDSLRIPGTRLALAEAIASEDPRKASIGLRFAASARQPGLGPAVRAALGHASPAVRTEAVRTATALALRGEDGRVRPFLAETFEPLRRAALEYLLTVGKDVAADARRLVDHDDRSLRDLALDLMEQKPALARGAITRGWVDRRIAAGTRDDLRDACRGLVHLAAGQAEERLEPLLAHEDLEVRRAALRALARRPALRFLDAVLGQLHVRGLRLEARAAAVAFGPLAVPRLATLTREGPDDQVRSVASAALGEIGGGAAHRALLDLAKSGDPGLRHHGLRNLNRMRNRTRRRQVSRRDAIRMFLRELRDDRVQSDFANAIPATANGALGLLRASYLEAADRALARACRALACYYWPAPLRGAYEGLRTGAPREASARALEYLGALLPGRTFRDVRGILEVTPPPDAEEIDRDALLALLERSSRSDDPWTRAVAERALADLGAPTTGNDGAGR